MVCVLLYLQLLQIKVAETLLLLTEMLRHFLQLWDINTYCVSKSCEVAAFMSSAAAETHTLRRWYGSCVTLFMKELISASKMEI